MKFFAGLGRFSVRYRWLIIVGWVIIVPLAVATMPSLSSVSQNANSSFLPNSAPSMKAAGLLEPLEPQTQGSAILVAVRENGSLTTKDHASIMRAMNSIGDIRQFVTSVRDVGTSADGHAEEVEIAMNVNGNSPTSSASLAVAALRKSTTQSGAPTGLTYYLTGSVPSEVDSQNSTGHTQNLTQELAMLFIIVLLLFVFRALLAPFVTLLPAVFALFLAGPLIAESARLGIQVSSLTQILLVVIVLGAGTDYGLFLIFRMREELTAGRAPKEAVTVAVTRVGESITFSAMTVIAAMLSLCIASFGLYKGLGPGLAIAIAVVLVANLTLLPALLSVLGRAVFWPARPKVGSPKLEMWGRVAGRVVKAPAATLAIGMVVFLALAGSMFDFSSGGFGATNAPSTSSSGLGEAQLAAHFSSVDSNPTNIVFEMKSSVWTDPTVLETVQKDLSTAPVFSSVAGALDPKGTVRITLANAQKVAASSAAGLSGAELTEMYKKFGPPEKLGISPPASSGTSQSEYQAYRATAQFVTSNGRTFQLLTSLSAGDPGNNPAIHAIPEVRSVVATVAKQIGAVDSGVVGEAAGTADVDNISTNDMIKVIPVVMLVLGLLLALVLRSLIAPLYLVLSVALSYLASLGFAVLVFVIIGNEGGINFVLPFLMFIFIMALGEDYNILMMTRIREEAHDLRLRDAVQKAVGATGTTITSAGMILAGTFGVLTVAGGAQVREIGVGLAAGVLLDTFFVRSLLVPSMVVLMGRWNWWPSKLWKLEDDDRFGREPCAMEKELRELELEGAGDGDENYPVLTQPTGGTLSSEETADRELVPD